MVQIFGCNPGKCAKCRHGGPFPGIIKTGRQGINGKPAARVTDTGELQCPHKGQFVIIEGAPNTWIEGQMAARVGDKIQCIVCGELGEIVKGSGDTFTQG